MMKRRTKIAALLTHWLLAMVAATAFADGDGPTRAMNPSEQAAYDAVRKGVRGSLSAPFPNYASKFTGFDGKAEIFEATKPDGMHRMAFSVAHTVSKEYEEQRMVAAVMGQTKGTPQQEVRLTEIRAKQESLRDARSRTRDRTEKDRIRAEIKELDREENQIVGAIAAGHQAGAAAESGVPGMAEVAAGLPPKRFDVRVLVNQDIRIHDAAKPFNVAGHPSSFESTDGCLDAGTYCVTVLVGQFEKAGKAGPATIYRPKNAPLGVPTKARALALLVSGPKDKPGMVQDLLGTVDLKSLDALVP